MKEFWFPYGATELPVPVDNGLSYKLLLPKKLGGRSLSVEAIANSALEKLLPEISGKNVALILPRGSVSQRLALTLVKKMVAEGVKKSLSIVHSADLNEILSGRNHRQKLGCGVKETFHELGRGELAFLGEAEPGAKMLFNKVALEADVKIVVGEARPSLSFNYASPLFQALLGLASEETIKSFLWRLEELALRDPFCAPFKAVKELAEWLPVDFAVTLVSDGESGVAKLIVGSADETLSEEEKIFNECWRVEFDNAATLVVGSAGGASFDSTFLNALPGLNSIGSLVEDGGTIIYLAECAKGLGLPPLKEGKDKLRQALRRFVLGRVSEVSNKARVRLVSALPDYYVQKILKFKPCKAGSSALKSIRRILKNEARMFVVPLASRVVPTRSGTGLDKNGEQ